MQNKQASLQKQVEHALFPAAVSCVCGLGKAPVGVSEDFVPQRVIKEGWIV